MKAGIAPKLQIAIQRKINCGEFMKSRATTSFGAMPSFVFSHDPYCSTVS